MLKLNIFSFIHTLKQNNNNNNTFKFGEGFSFSLEAHFGIFNYEYLKVCRLVWRKQTNN